MINQIRVRGYHLVKLFSRKSIGSWLLSSKIWGRRCEKRDKVDGFNWVKDLLNYTNNKWEIKTNLDWKHYKIERNKYKKECKIRNN